MARPRARAAQRKVTALEEQLAPARRARDVGRMYEEGARRVLRTQERRQFAGGAPLWLYTAVDVMSVFAAEAICKAQGYRPDAMPRVAAYIGSGLWDVYSRAITEFDPDHMEMMEATNGDAAEDAGPSRPADAGAGANAGRGRVDAVRDRETSSPDGRGAVPGVRDDQGVA